MAPLTADDPQVEVPQDLRLSAAALRGLAKGQDPTDYRDKTDRL